MLQNERSKLLSGVENVGNDNFDALALEVFRYQATNNALYGRFLELLGRKPAQIRHWSDIPCLPVSFFKTHTIQSGDWQPEAVFSSSSTSSQTPSRHPVRDADFYLRNTLRGFEAVYGSIKGMLILALLPSYLERSGSSLVLMADYFIRASGNPDSGFFLYNHEELLEKLRKNNNSGQQKILLLGVSFALLDLAEQYSGPPLPNLVVMETGGMKGRRKELTRSELHSTLKAAFGLKSIHSEYGMTEMFSQAWSTGEGIFKPSASLRVFATDVYDPLSPTRPGKTGILNLIDLANVDSCAFLATEDLGKVYSDGSFEVLGRMDAAELRGCNLMIES
ncbi:MAG: acyl transferase [Chitinophagales bacterium]|nr:acyl transferase [Chitinophagales bacterium]